MQPTISIIVPCLNEEKRLRFLLDAIISQTYPRTLLEVIIANGDSRDRTLEVISTFKQEHADLSLVVI